MESKPNVLGLNTNTSSSYPRTNYGIFMALACAFWWAILAPMLELAVTHFSALFIVWFRFFSSFILLFIILAWRGREPLKTLFHPPPMALIAGTFLVANYYGFMKGVQLGGSISAQILIQLANVGLIAIGMLFFRERLSKAQVWGLCMVFFGMGTFIFEKGKNMVSSDISAIIYLVCAAILWSIYAALQKQVSQRLSPQLTNLVVFFVAALLLSPFINSGELLSAPLAPLLALCFCAMNTLVAYGALAEALKHAPVTVVSPIIALNPLGTVVAVNLLSSFQLPWLRAEQLGLLAYIAGLCALIGVAIVVGNKRQR